MRAQPHLLGELYELDTLARALWSSENHGWTATKLKVRSPAAARRAGDEGAGSRF
jgi:hypothetical protein